MAKKRATKPSLDEPVEIDERATFVVVANRLPVDRQTDADGNVTWRTSPGGLVTALEPVMKQKGGAWVGWDGGKEAEHMDPFEHDGYSIIPVPLTAQEYEEYYEGFSNASLWPLYHDCIATPMYHREWFDAYRKVNRRFAEQTAAVAAENAVVWVQDYQLQLVPQMLRELRPDLKIGYFLHIPFPPFELFMQLPWRRAIVEGLLGADLIGFQVPDGASNFARLSRKLLEADVAGDTITYQGRESIARAYPISIDAQQFLDMSRSPEVVEEAYELRHRLGNPKKLFLGVDRLDYTKGIIQRVRAFGELVRDGHLDADDVCLIQVATPSRERVSAYKDLRDEVDLLCGRINSELGGIGRSVVDYHHTSFPRTTMAALYRAADIALVTPLRDGMNLVCKEYVAAHEAADGALVLSEFAGAALELTDAYMVNPYDLNGMKNIILQAVNDEPDERARRMKAMQEQVFSHTIADWAASFLADLGEKK